MNHGIAAMIAGSTKSRMRGASFFESGLRAGSSRRVTASAIGYSATVRNASGATMALKIPPSAPPTAIHR